MRRTKLSPSMSLTPATMEPLADSENCFARAINFCRPPRADSTRRLHESLAGRRPISAGLCDLVLQAVFGSIEQCRRDQYFHPASLRPPRAVSGARPLKPPRCAERLSPEMLRLNRPSISCGIAVSLKAPTAFRADCSAHQDARPTASLAAFHRATVLGCRSCSDVSPGQLSKIGLEVVAPWPI